MVVLPDEPIAEVVADQREAQAGLGADQTEVRLFQTSPRDFQALGCARDDSAARPETYDAALAVPSAVVTAEASAAAHSPATAA